MIRVIGMLAIMLTGCAGMTVECPDTVTEIRCPQLPDNYTDAEFRAELLAEIATFPSGTALGQAGIDMLALARTIKERCGAT